MGSDNISVPPTRNLVHLEFFLLCGNLKRELAFFLSGTTHAQFAVGLHFNVLILVEC